ncbi:MAG: 6-phosphogluconolactonase [Candidatus Atribacteria bacterium]|nr:6-phosphogluconolactonase [Candidatus Atribacteria bacterium]
MKTVKVMVFNKTEELFFHLVDKWNEIGSQACQSRGLFNVAVSGGQSPQPFFTQLSENKEINFWDKTHIFMVDERFISPFHKDSNQQMIREQLINKVNISIKNFHEVSIKNDVFQSAREYEQTSKSRRYEKTHHCRRCSPF